MKKQLLIALAAAAPLLFTACVKETKTGPQAQVKFINGSINNTATDITFDGVLLISNVSFPDASNYSFVNTGTPVAKIQPTTGTAVYASANVSLQENVNYTIVATDSVSKMKASIVTDDLSAPATGKAKIRFFHLIGNANTISVDTSITTAGTTLFGGRTFNDQATNSGAGTFITVNAATYKFAAKDVSTSTAVPLFNQMITLADGKIYTIIAKGAIGGTTTAGTPGFVVLAHN